MQLARVPRRHRQELVEGVEFQELNAGLLEDLPFRYELERPVHHPLRPGVAVTSRISEELVVTVQ